MPRKKKEMVEEKPIPIYEPSEYFYKCFIFDSSVPDMVIDSSGTIFARELPTAIANVYEEQTSQDIISSGVASLFSPDNDPIEIKDRVSENEWLRHFFVLRVKLHDKTELNNIARCDDGNSLILSLKDLQHGSTMAMQEYLIDSADFNTDKNSNMHLRAIKAHVEDVERISKEFPETIAFKY